MKTHIIIILDQSGSEGTSSEKNKVTEGFNLFIKQQKEIKGDEANITFIKFDIKPSTIIRCSSLATIEELSDPLSKYNSHFVIPFFLFINAIAEGIKIGEETEENFDRIICIIMTDGNDYSGQVVPFGQIIRKKENEGKWTFLCIGENHIRWADQTGMSYNNVAKYDHQKHSSSFDQAQLGVQKIRMQKNRKISNVFNHQ